MFSILYEDEGSRLGYNIVMHIWGEGLEVLFVSALDISLNDLRTNGRTIKKIKECTFPFL